MTEREAERGEETTVPDDRKVYLGDGAYVRWDAERRQVVLSAENGVTATDVVYLEEEVLGALLGYLKQQFPNAGVWKK